MVVFQNLEDRNKVLENKHGWFFIKGMSMCVVGLRILTPLEKIEGFPVWVNIYSLPSNFGVPKPSQILVIPLVYFSSWMTLHMRICTNNWIHVRQDFLCMAASIP